MKLPEYIKVYNWRIKNKHLMGNVYINWRKYFAKEKNIHWYNHPFAFLRLLLKFGISKWI